MRRARPCYGRSARSMIDGLGEREFVGDGEWIDAHGVALRREAAAALAQRRRSAPGSDCPDGRLTTPMSRQNTPGAEARAERLGAGLLGGEALGVGGGARRPPRPICAAPIVGEDALEEAVAVALEGALDPPDVDDVVAEADDHRDAPARAFAFGCAGRIRAFSMMAFMRRTLSPSPTKTASPTR